MRSKSVVMSILVAMVTVAALASGGRGRAESTPLPTPRDEAACGRCGDGACVKRCGETPTSCPIDCGVPSANLD